MSYMTVPETLSDYDLLELVAFGSKVEHEGYSYAASDYPPRFEFNNLQLLDRATLGAVWSRHRASVDLWWETHPGDGVDLHNAHIDAARERIDGQRLWGARYDHGAVSACDSEREARFLVFNPSWRAAQLLRRDEPGGEWTVVEDTAGLEQDVEWRWVRQGDGVLVDGVWLTVTEIGKHVVDRSPRGSRFSHETFWVLSDGRRVETPPYWEEQPVVRIRRRAAVPA